MKGLEIGHRDAETANEDAHELPDEAEFMRKIFERGDVRISVDCAKLERYISDRVEDPELRQVMMNRLVFIMMEMDPSLRPQALVQFFQQYYVQFSGDADLQRMIDFILNYEAMELLRLVISRLH